MPPRVLGLGGLAPTVALVAFVRRVLWLIGAIPAGLLVDRADRGRVVVGASTPRLIVLLRLRVAHGFEVLVVAATVGCSGRRGV